MDHLFINWVFEMKLTVIRVPGRDQDGEDAPWGREKLIEIEEIGVASV